jgi:toxin ParE1/3/4
MKLGYRISKAASRDLNEIASYTRHMWGATQQRIYLTNLEECFNTLVDQPQIGLARSEFTGVRSIHLEHHVIFYTITKAGILIVRVLHERQDPTRHLER